MSYRFLFYSTSGDRAVKVCVCTICGCLVTSSEIDVSDDIMAEDMQQGLDVHTEWHETFTRVARQAERANTWITPIT